MKKEAVVMTDELFDSMIMEDKWVHEIAFAHGCCDKFGKVDHYETCSYPHNYIVSTEQIDRAKAKYQMRKRQVLDGIQKNELVFVSMGAGFDDGPDNVGNHRIRCEFRNSSGHRYFVEFLSGMNGGCTFSCDFSVDKELEAKRKADLDEFYKVHKGERLFPKYADEMRELDRQDYYEACGLKRGTIFMGFSWKNVLEVVNKTFGCKYTSARKLDYFVRSEEYYCWCD